MPKGVYQRKTFKGESLVGKRYGSLLVISLAHKRASRNRVMWECLCDCGIVKYMLGEALRAGRYTSCGCARKRTGSNHPSYKDIPPKDRGKIRLLAPEYKLWRNLVFCRDGFKCCVCGDHTSGNIEAHHLMSYSAHIDFRFLPINGVTLCRPCHKDFHKTYGYVNNTLTQFLHWQSIKEFRL